MQGSARCRRGFWVCGRFEVLDGTIVHWRDYFDGGNALFGVGRGVVKAVLAKATTS